MPTKKEKQPLSVTHPELAKEADGWDSTEITKGSHKKLQWKCKKHHVWVAAVNSRVLGRGCPVCSNKSVLVGVNDLATTHPHIAIEAFGWDPTTVTFGSSKRKTWKCAIGHIWETTIGTRRI